MADLIREQPEPECSSSSVKGRGFDEGGIETVAAELCLSYVSIAAEFGGLLMRFALLSACLIASTSVALAEEKIFNCTEKAQGGFANPDKSKVPETLTAKKMKIVLDGDKMTVTLFGASPETYACRKAFLNGKKPELIQCQENTYFMVLNTSDGRFARSQMFGYVGNNLGAQSDSLTVSFGDCE